MKNPIVYAVCAVCLLAAGAQAGPLKGEDASFLGKDGRKVEAWVDYSVSREGADKYSTSAYGKLTYGLFDNLDLKVAVPWKGWNSSGISESGLGDVQIEAKFGCNCRSGWGLALKPGFSMPAGDETRSLGAGKGGVWLYGVTDRKAGPWRFLLNAGYMYNRNSLDKRESLLKGSAAAVFRLSGKVRATLRLSASTSTDKDSLSHPLLSTLGLCWSPYDTLDLRGGVKTGLNRGAEDFGLVTGLLLRL